MNNNKLLTIAAVFLAALIARADDNATNSVEATPPSAPAITGPLQFGDALKGVDAPQIANHAFQVLAEIEPLGTNGVIVSQGAGANGFALYLDGGKPAFALRRTSQLTTVVAEKILSASRYKVQARLETDGKISISVDGEIVATGQAAGLIQNQPARSLSVGIPYQAVGDYKLPNSFVGKIQNVFVQTF